MWVPSAIVTTVERQRPKNIGDFSAIATTVRRQKPEDKGLTQNMIFLNGLADPLSMKFLKL